MQCIYQRFVVDITLNGESFLGRFKKFYQKVIDINTYQQHPVMLKSQQLRWMKHPDNRTLPTFILIKPPCEPQQRLPNEASQTHSIDNSLQEPSTGKCIFIGSHFRCLIILFALMTSSTFARVNCELNWHVARMSQ